jgi:hypothetical protein
MPQFDAWVQTPGNLAHHEYIRINGLESAVRNALPRQPQVVHQHHHAPNPADVAGP